MILAFRLTVSKTLRKWSNFPAENQGFRSILKFRNVLCNLLIIGGFVVLPDLTAVEASSVGGFGNLPLYFEANRGQTEGSTQFIARNSEAVFSLSPTEVAVRLRNCGTAKDNREPRAIRFQLIGANRE